MLVSFKAHPMQKMALVYSTFPTQEDAARAGRLLIERKLAACINIIPDLTSIFSWKGTIDSAGEVLMLAKTTEALVPEAMDLIKQHHPYETPVIASIALSHIADGAAEWLRSELGKLRAL
jgi:periplasmic divalent cation tolerance protein